MQLDLQFVTSEGAKYFPPPSLPRDSRLTLPPYLFFTFKQPLPSGSDSICSMCLGEKRADSFGQFPGAGRFGSEVQLTLAASTERAGLSRASAR